MFQNKQKVVVVTGGDPTRVIKVQAGTGDPSRVPVVTTDGVLGRDQQVQVVSGGDSRRFPILNGVNPILALSPAAYYQYQTGITVTGAGVSMWADQADSDNALISPNVISNNASITDAGSILGSGDIEIVLRANSRDMSTAAQQTLVSKAASFQFLFTSGAPSFWFSLDGGTSINTFKSSGGAALTANTTYWLKVTRAKASGDVKFYTAPDSVTEPTSWTQHGTTQTSTAGVAVGGNTNAITVAALTSATWNGKIYRCILRSGIDGTTVFDADFSAQAKGTTSFTESSSNAATVTVNQSGALPAHIGNQKDLLQGTDGNRPAHSGGIITFDGVDNYLKTNAFTLNQPETIYLVVNQVSWTANEYIFDGNSVASMACRQRQSGGASGDIEITTGGAAVAQNSNLAVGSYGVVAVVFNGASSLIQVNANAATTGNAGATNGGGFTLASLSSGGNCSNIAVKECAIFASAHDAATRSQVISYLMAKHGIS